MTRTLTGLNPRSEQRRQSIILDRLVARYQRRIAAEISRAMRKAAKNIKFPEQYQAQHVERMAALLHRLWKDSGGDMANHVGGQAKAITGLSRKADDDSTVQPTEAADRIMQTWINTEGALEIRKITDKTLKDIKRQIEKGIADGLSEKEIAANIRAVSPSIAASRSQTIARTETHAAANVSAQATAEASGLDMEREWVASRGNRTRDSHRKADGQRVGMDETFTVGRASLRWPGDQRAGAPEETINCRCAVSYVLKR